MMFKRITLLTGLLAFTVAADVRAGWHHGEWGHKPTTFEDVLRFVKQGMSATTLLGRCDTVFTFGSRQREQLRNAGASAALIAALQRPRKKPGAARDMVIILGCSGGMGNQRVLLFAVLPIRDGPVAPFRERGSPVRPDWDR